MQSTQTLFAEAYNKNSWGNEESRSGRGSTELYTRRLRQFLPPFLRMLEVKSILDAPCGDFNWMRLVELGDILYLGGDIVPAIIDDNAQKYPEKKFVTLDILNDKMPNCDFWLCRD